MIWNTLWIMLCGKFMQSSYTRLWRLIHITMNGQMDDGWPMGSFCVTTPTAVITHISHTWMYFLLRLYGYEQNWEKWEMACWTFMDYSEYITLLTYGHPIPYWRGPVRVDELLFDNVRSAGKLSFYTEFVYTDYQYSNHTQMKNISVCVCHWT